MVKHIANQIVKEKFIIDDNMIHKKNNIHKKKLV